ncbi:MAG: PEP-CTERM sorting domain-containing protein [Planctomycetota bacterium]
MKSKGILAGVLIALLSFSTVHAALVSLSDCTTDETPASDLNAMVEFSLTGSTLSIVLTNLTDGPDSGIDTGYDITALYFNATDNIFGLTLEEPDFGWVLYSWDNITKAGGLGQFDYVLKGKIGSNPIIVEGESSRTFTLSVTHDGSGASESDFYSEFSSRPPGNDPTIIAAKFQRGPNDDSAFGGTHTPEPATITILGLGSMIMFIKRKRR